MAENVVCCGDGLVSSTEASLMYRSAYDWVCVCTSTHRDGTYTYLVMHIIWDMILEVRATFINNAAKLLCESVSITPGCTEETVRSQWIERIYVVNIIGGNRYWCHRDSPRKT
eukprot:scaffold172022_cov24-Prasinocladus_malaysianus.AAC.1